MSDQKTAPPVLGCAATFKKHDLVMHAIELPTEDGGRVRVGWIYLHALEDVRNMQITIQRKDPKPPALKKR